MVKKYSVCITQYNNVRTVKRSLESILNQLDDQFEVVVVDNMSGDGSYEVLREFEKARRISLIQAKSTRGRGRQIAFENSSGDYIVANMDMDDVFKPRLSELLVRYHALAEGKLLWAFSRMRGLGFWGGEAFTIAPRRIISELGGWRDLQVFEDMELCARAARKGLYLRGEFSLLDATNLHPERTRTAIGRMRWKYLRYREILRCGFPLQLWSNRESWKQRLLRMGMNAVVLPFYEKFDDSYNREFPMRLGDPRYSVPLEGVGRGKV